MEPVYSLIGQFVHAGLIGKAYIIGIVIFVLACSYKNDRVKMQLPIKYYINDPYRVSTQTTKKSRYNELARECPPFPMLGIKSPQLA